MRLSDAGLRRRQTNLIYPDHRLPPWPNETRPRDRSNRLLGAGASDTRDNDYSAAHRTVMRLAFR
jgi:hypothetical protein